MPDLTVCHVSTLTRWGGVERLSVDLLLGVNQQSVRHILLTTSSAPEILKTIRNAGIVTFQPRRRFRYDPTAIFQMANWLRQQKVDIVHTYNTFANTWGGLASQIAGIPFVAGEHGTTWNVAPPMSWLENLALKQAKKIIANSKASAQMLQLKRGIPAAKIQVVYNAIPPLPVIDKQTIRCQFGFTPGQLLIGSVGRLDTPKHFSLLVKVAAMILQHRNDIRFLLVGGGPLETTLRHQIEKFDIADKFVMSGWRKDARSVVQILDLFVSTSIRETFGNAIIEAGLAKIPAIAPAVDGIPEAVLDGQTGVLLEPTDPVSLVPYPGASSIDQQVLINGKLQPPKAINQQVLLENILKLLDNPQQRLIYGSAAQARAQSMFTMNRYITQLENIYINVLGEAQ